jgi:hypothetical protein
MKELLGVFLFVTSIHGAIYYVDFAGGDNSNNGTSTATPWKHAPGDAQATGNANRALSAGDVVVYKGGVVYNGYTTITNSGASGNPIQYLGNPDGTWGTGMPIINLSNRTDVTRGFGNEASVSWIVISNFTLTEIGGYTQAELDAMEADTSLAFAPPRSGVGIAFTSGNYAASSNIKLYKLRFSEMGSWENHPKYKVASGIPGVPGSMSGSAITILGCTDVWIEDVDLTRTFTGVNFKPSSTTKPLANLTYTNFNHHNYIRWTIDIGPAGTGHTLSNIFIKGGRIYDYHEYDLGNWIGISEKPHTDGIMCHNSYDSTWTNVFFDGIHFWADEWGNSKGGTGSIFISQGPSVTVQNCTLGFTKHSGGFSRSYFARSPGQRVRFRHNTINSIQTLGNATHASTNWPRFIEVYGNVLTSPSSDMTLGLQKFRDTIGTGLNYTFWNIGTNLYFRWAYPDNPNADVVNLTDSAYRSLSEFQALLGGGVYDVGSTYEDPLLVDATNSTSSLRNYRVASASSPVRDRCNCDLAWDADGNARDEWHDLGAYEYTGVVTIPDAPTGLSATAISTTEINLSWNDVAGETGYKLERKTGSGGTYAQIATPAQNATSYSDSGLTAETTYYYRIRATNSAGDSDYSSEANATTLAPEDPPPPTDESIKPGRGIGRRR